MIYKRFITAYFFVSALYYANVLALYYSKVLIYYYGSMLTLYYANILSLYHTKIKVKVSQMLNVCKQMNVQSI